jgi:hypothetical protein
MRVTRSLPNRSIVQCGDNLLDNEAIRFGAEPVPAGALYA